MRKHIFPALNDAYDDWLESGNPVRLESLVDKSRSHWQSVAIEMLALYEQYGENSHEHIEDLVNKSTL
jgi:hypothetical protein